jgi:hypothetical protein
MNLPVRYSKRKNMTAKVYRFPFKETPLWQYLVDYYQKRKGSPIQGEVFLVQHVPTQLHKQFREYITFIEEESKRSD